MRKLALILTLAALCSAGLYATSQEHAIFLDGFESGDRSMWTVNEIQLVGTCTIEFTPFLEFSLVFVYRPEHEFPARLLVQDSFLDRFPLCGTGATVIVTGYVPDEADPISETVPRTTLIATDSATWAAPVP